MSSRRRIRNATIAGDIDPVLCGTSYRNKGVQMLLDAIVELSALARWIFLR